ncbi:MAG: response regulator transcription factor [Nitrosomonadales bacterium]|nr:response regulator transcription factor [Nitrosomonadales bacterium]
MSPRGYTVYMVEDDAPVRDALGLLLGLQGYPVAMFGDAESFLSALKPDWRGCALIDIRMPGMDGLSLQKHLRETGCDLPVIVMTAHGDVDSARDAFRSQAVDFLEKPVEQNRLFAAIEEAFARQAATHQAELQQGEFARLLATLTPREKEVMEMVVAGRHNREIAELLGISPRTVEVHKARMMAKLQVSCVPDLVRLNLAGPRDQT